MALRERRLRARTAMLALLATAVSAADHAPCVCSDSAPSDTGLPDDCDLLTGKGGGPNQCRCDLIGQAAGEATSKCLVSCGCVDDATQQRCRSTGDPHYTGWDNDRFDFMGVGAYRLAAAPLARCGCDLDVQTFTGPNKLLGSGAAGASSNVAVAARFGAVVMTILGDRSLRITDPTAPDGGLAIPFKPYDEWEGWEEQAELEAAYKVERVGKKGDADNDFFRGWRIAVPGGGTMLVMGQTHGILNVWLTLPGDSKGTKGLCAEDFTPGSWCDRKKRTALLPSTTCKNKACVPLWQSESLFDAATLQDLEKEFLRGKSSTRSPTLEAKCKPPTDPPPDDAECADDACTTVCTHDAAAATATMPQCPDPCPGEVCTKTGGDWGSGSWGDGGNCAPQSNHKGKWWHAADRFVQCRNKLFESDSAEEVDPAKAEKCADPNCGNRCQQNHCKNVATLRWLWEKGEKGAKDILDLVDPVVSSSTPAFQYKSWVVGCTLAHFYSKHDKTKCFNECNKEHSCEASNNVLNLAGVVNRNSGEPAQQTEKRCDSADCCGPTGTSRSICRKACAYYFNDYDDPDRPGLGNGLNTPLAVQRYPIDPSCKRGETPPTWTCNTDVKIAYGPKQYSPAGTPKIKMSSCSSWCAEEAKSNCKLSTALHAGAWKDYQLFCGFFSDYENTNNGRCAAIVGRKLQFEPYYFKGEARGEEYFLHGDDITVVEIGGNWIGTSEPYQNGDGYFAPGRGCDINTQTLDECEPTVPELCELTGSTLAEAESLCATVCPELRDECIYDVCVFGIDDPVVQTFAEATQNTCDIEKTPCEFTSLCDAPPPDPKEPPKGIVRVECEATDSTPARTCLYRAERPPRYPCCTTCEGGSCPNPVAEGDGTSPSGFFTLPDAQGPSLGADASAALGGVQLGG